MVDESAFFKMEIARLEAANTALKQRTYAAPHVWNLTAKAIREEYPTATRSQRRVLEQLALRFARRFREDEGFDPLRWLDQCSPNTELYPFSEMWEA